MNLRANRSRSSFLLITALVLILFSCDDKGEPIPFPEEKTELLPPASEPLRYNEAKKFEWQVNDSVTFEKARSDKGGFGLGFF